MVFWGCRDQNTTFRSSCLFTKSFFWFIRSPIILVFPTRSLIAPFMILGASQLLYWFKLISTCKFVFAKISVEILYVFYSEFAYLEQIIYMTRPLLFNFFFLTILSSTYPFLDPDWDKTIKLFFETNSLWRQRWNWMNR